jgi:hypothetical protein
VSSLVGDGDTVSIDAGTYVSDVARWTANDLVLRGSGGLAHLDADGASYGSKAIWVIAGTNTTVESIEFSRCRVPDKNGAGIRQEGATLTVRGCYFHDNETGILSGDGASSDILIERTEFFHNGNGDGYSHNLYINHVRSLIFRFNYSHGAIIGHELKSRAYRNVIAYNRIANESNGTASREIDLPNGGTAVIVGNEIEQGPSTTNSNIIGYGMEGLSNPTSHSLYVVNNTMVNDRGSGIFVAVANSTELVKLYNNVIAGTGTVLTGTPITLDSAGNVICSIAAAGFIDPSSYNYGLAPSSPAIDRGVDPGAESGVTLMPEFEYLHPVGFRVRDARGPLDAGAHEYSAPSQVEAGTRTVRVLSIY